YLAGDMVEEDRELFQEAISGFEVLVFGPLLPWGEFCRELRAWLQDTGQVPVQGKLASSPRERRLSRRLRLAKRQYLAGDMEAISWFRGLGLRPAAAVGRVLPRLACLVEDRELFQEAISGFELRAWLLDTGQAPVPGKLASSPHERGLSRRLSLAKREYLAGDMA
ncbi:unnamed protein product, partial [Prorocentrum cordatum]